MKICMSCGQSVQDVDAQCPRCGGTNLVTDKSLREQSTKRARPANQFNGAAPTQVRQPMQPPPGYRNMNGTAQQRQVNQRPVGIPGQRPGGSPGQRPMGVPGQRPMGVPGQRPAGAMGQRPVSVPGQRPMGVPGQRPMGVPGQRPMNNQVRHEPEQTVNYEQSSLDPYSMEDQGHTTDNWEIEQNSAYEQMGQEVGFDSGIDESSFNNNQQYENFGQSESEFGSEFGSEFAVENTVEDTKQKKKGLFGKKDKTTNSGVSKLPKQARQKEAENRKNKAKAEKEAKKVKPEKKVKPKKQKIDKAVEMNDEVVSDTNRNAKNIVGSIDINSVVEVNDWVKIIITLLIPIYNIIFAVTSLSKPTINTSIKNYLKVWLIKCILLLALCALILVMFGDKFSSFML